MVIVNFGKKVFSLLPTVTSGGIYFFMLHISISKDNTLWPVNNFRMKAQ